MTTRIKPTQDVRNPEKNLASEIAKTLATDLPTRISDFEGPGCKSLLCIRSNQSAPNQTEPTPEHALNSLRATYSFQVLALPRQTCHCVLLRLVGLDFARILPSLIERRPRAGKLRTFRAEHVGQRFLSFNQHYFGFRVLVSREQGLAIGC